MVRSNSDIVGKAIMALAQHHLLHNGPIDKIAMTEQ